MLFGFVLPGYEFDDDLKEMGLSKDKAALDYSQADETMSSSIMSAEA